MALTKKVPKAYYPICVSLHPKTVRVVRFPMSSDDAIKKFVEAETARDAALTVDRVVRRFGELDSSDAKTLLWNYAQANSSNIRICYKNGKVANFSPSQCNFLCTTKLRSTSANSEAETTIADF